MGKGTADVGLKGGEGSFTRGGFSYERGFLKALWT